MGHGGEHPTPSARPRFERQLEALQGAVTTLGEMVDKAIFRAADALERRSETMARRVLREDGRIGRHRAGVEADVLHLLGQQHPAASDLRFVVAVLHMTTDLERMGDHARNVARFALSLIHLRNMVAVTEAGATVLPPTPGFYHRPTAIDDLIDQTTGKVLDQLGIEHELFRRWATPGTNDRP